MRTITLFGVALVLIGTVLLAGPAFGFATISADRGVMVQTAGDDEGLLEITDTSDGATVSPENEPTLFEVMDTTGQISDITVDSVSIAGTETADLDVIVEQDDGTYTVSVACDESDRETAATISVTLEASGDVHVVADRTTENTVSIECGAEEESYDDEFDGGNDDIDIEDDGTFEEDVDLDGNGGIAAGGDLTFEDDVELDGTSQISTNGTITFEGSVSLDGNSVVYAEEDIICTEPPEISGNADITAEGETIGCEL
ncbi:hypothetical protein C483_09629 [Natrialba hulunbeirensis JCM 10989]|uniref:Uncharacterized protein n=1 Tax=Natrialba hulunbeirensis JCM 10989 TaxID=1227493 RepID=L9ZZJ9_9EURY|nr:hypothetical protein [Natrialba hulunbeirensis]ELY91789.1 hypothetical protein C483_09629 [Natrialba hulunbeirensis JCM 10989]